MTLSTLSTMAFADSKTESQSDKSGTTPSTEPADKNDDDTDPETTDEPTQGNTSIYETNITNNYYYFDVGLQFKPKVGIVTSINNQSGLLYGGSLDSYIWDGSDTWASGGYITANSTLWTPELSELPDFTDALGRYFQYGVLYNGYWNNSLVSPSNKYNLAVYSIKPTTDTTDGVHDNATAGAGAVSDSDSGEFLSFEPSWANRNPGLTITDDHEYVNFYTSDELAIYNVAPYSYSDLDDFISKQSRAYVSPWYSVKNTLIANRPTPSNSNAKLFYGTSGIAAGCAHPALSNYVHTMWYKNTDVATDTQVSTGLSGALFVPEEYKTDEFLRALEILGADILFRDEWVTRVFVTENRADPKPPDGTTTADYKGLYTYVYNPISVLDNDKLKGKDLLTLDYVIQSLYRAVGVNCLKTHTFLYKDITANVDFTPLAEKITVQMDRINQIQNHMQVFVTRTALDDYWQRAVDDGLVTESGELTYNTLDAIYKPFMASVSEENGSPTLRNPNDSTKKWSYDNTSAVNGTVYVEHKALSSGVTITKKYAAERFTHITLADFCVLAKRMMDIYGEEVMTDKEQEMLLVTYGSKLPYDLEAEEFEAVKYLMAKGIVEDQMFWTGELQIEDMIVILSRIADKGSRLTFKEVDIVYDPDLVSAGYYPAKLNITTPEESPVQVQSVSFTSGKSYANAEWVDFFVQLSDVTVKDSSGKEVTVNPRFSITDDAGNVISYTENIFLVEHPITGNSYSTGSISKRSNSSEFRVVEIVRGNDGYEYMHFQVSAETLFNAESESHKRFVSGYDDYNPKNVLCVNTSNQSDSPVLWTVSPTGGVFTMPTGQPIEKSDGDVEETAPARVTINYLDGGYNNTFSYSKESTTTLENLETHKLKLSDNEEVAKLGVLEKEVTLTLDEMKSLGFNTEGVTTPKTFTPSITLKDGYVSTGVCYDFIPIGLYKKVRPTDYATLNEWHISSTGGFVLDGEGYVKYGKYNRILNSPSVKGYMSFDQAGMSIEYCDRQRYYMHLASLFSNNPYLEDTKAADSKKSITSLAVPTYNIVFSLPHKIVQDHNILWGDSNTVIISKNTPTNLPIQDVVKLRYLYSTSTYYTYVVEGAHTVSEVSTYLHLDDASTAIDATYNIGYMKEQNALLVPTTTLMEIISNSSVKSYIDNINTVLLNEDTLMLSFDTKAITSDYTDSYKSVHTVILNDALDMIAINGVIYKLSNDETLFQPVDVKNPNGEYYVNYKALTGYISGYTVSTVSTTGAVNISIGDDRRPEFQEIKDVWTGKEYNINATTHITSDGSVELIDLSGPNNLANFALYVSDTAGTFLFTLKNNDKYASNGYLATEANQANVVKQYSLGYEYLRDWFGLDVGADGTANSDILVACTLISEAAGTMITGNLEEYKSSEVVGKIYFDPSTTTYSYIAPNVCTQEEFGFGQELLWTADVGKRLNHYDDFVKMSTFIATKYYSNKWLLPFFSTTYDNNKNDSTFTYAITSNIFEGLPYGIAPIFAMSLDLTVNNQPLQKYYENDPKADLLMTMCGDTKADNPIYFDSHPIHLAPTGLPFLIIGMPQMSKEELIDVNTVDYTTFVYGSYIDKAVWDYSKKSINIFSTNNFDFMGTMNISLDKVRLVTGSVYQQWVAIDSFDWSYSEERDIIIKNAKKPNLVDADQPSYIDWDEYTFETLIHDIDNGLTIVLIIVLNFLPRLGMFVFLLLITLGTVANVYWWKKFCKSIFDPYKLLTFGHADVTTIDSKRLLITSIIGLAVFALFMDGTLIHVLTWLCQFVMKLIGS